MTSALSRLLLPALLTFLAGGVLGFAAGRRLAPPQEGSPGLGARLDAWYAATVQALDLDAEQASGLRALLRAYARQLRAAQQAVLPPLSPQPSELDLLAESWLRYLHLTPEQERAWERLVAPGAFLSGHSAHRYPDAPWPAPSD